MKLVKGLAILLGLLGMLALASSMFVEKWHGGFPSGQIRLSIVDQNGKPVPGTVLRVFKKGTREPAYGSPFAEYTESNLPTSDPSGEIVLLRAWGGYEFGGRTWYLFWIIEMGDTVPKFDCELSHEGYQTLVIDLWEVFKSPYKSFEDAPKIEVTWDGEKLKVLVYENTFVLKPDKVPR